MRDEQILPLPEQEIAAEVESLNTASIASTFDGSTFQSRRQVFFRTRPDQKAVQAKAYTFKRKTPLPGAYPLHYSPYRLANPSSSNNSVSLTPAEIYSDCKEIREGTRTEFSSEYFAEHEDAGISVATTVEELSDSKTLRINSVKRNPAPRYSERRVLSSVQLAMPKTIQEERRQIRAAMKASVESVAATSRTRNSLHRLPDIEIESSSSSLGRVLYCSFTDLPGLKESTKVKNVSVSSRP
jgi:hypothetical protein